VFTDLELVRIIGLFSGWHDEECTPNGRTFSSYAFRGLSRSILSTIRLASATASAMAATYMGLFRDAVASFRAARIAAQMAMTADLRGSATAER
jgi:hypothetical protein